MTATPRPWRLRETGTLQVWGPGRRWVATVMQPDGDNGLAPTDPESRANAALIVRAVNRDEHYDALLTFVQGVAEWMHQLDPRTLQKDARALLARIARLKADTMELKPAPAIEMKRCPQCKGTGVLP